jgi:tRNA-splicing ligase RtcB
MSARDPRRPFPAGVDVPVGVWLPAPGKLPRPVETALRRLARVGDVARMAVMPDVHLAEDVCVGVCLATRRRIYPAAVGSDIGCGMAALAFDAPADLLSDGPAAERLLEAVQRAVPTNRHPPASVPATLPAALSEAALPPLSDPRLISLSRRDGRVQFATLGRGNHFLEFQREESGDRPGRLWAMVHSGSRAMGPAVTAHHAASAPRDEATGLAWLDADSPAGRAYLADVEWCRRYADLGRREMLSAVERAMADLFGVAADPATLIACDHNHVSAESHLGERLWVHRKGVLPAGEGRPGVIPGSMGSASYHVVGRGEPSSLDGCSHGAGRAMSRAEAAGRITVGDLRRRMGSVRFDPRLADRLREEAPSAYKDIDAVMRAQSALTRIVRRLRPLLVHKGT